MDYMEQALALARTALLNGDVPVGALVVREGEVVGQGYNRRERDGDIFGHAELIAMKNAANTLGGWRLSGCTLYVTLEPCAMCAAAAVSAQLKRIVFGAFDQSFGACGSCIDLTDGRIGRVVEIAGGVYERSCTQILTDFFSSLRLRNPLRS